MAIVGLDAKLYHNTGTYGSPVWAEIDKARDVTTSMEAGEADVSSRSSGGWRETLQTLKDASIEFDLVWDTAAEGFTELRDSLLNGVDIEMLVLDGLSTATGKEGLRATFRVFNFSRNEPLEDAVTASVSMKVAPSSNNPAWYTVV
jgi:hypothetical protein